MSLIKSKDTITVYHAGNVATIPTNSEEAAEVLEAARKGDFALAVALANKARRITTFAKGVFTVDNGVVSRNGVAVHNTITTRILDFVKDRLPFEGLLAFLQNLEENPSNRAKAEGYDFLENKNLPITEDGFFLAYKSVRSDYYSKAAGTLTLLKGKTENGHIFNGIGEEIECVRNEVDDDRQNECSHGLHVGALAYSGPKGWYNSSGDKVVVVKVNPRDIVSVPKDHDAQKLRVCAYTVLEDFKAAFEQPLVSATGKDYEGNSDMPNTVGCADCDWEGNHKQLGDDYTCPVCLSDYVETL